MTKTALLILAALCAVPVSADTFTIFASANSMLEQAAPNTVWQDVGTIDLQHYLPGQERTDIFKFNLSGLPAGATVTAARFYVYDTGWNDTDTQSLYWHPDSSWNPSTVTWNTFPMESNRLMSGLSGTTGWQYNTWNIDVNSWDWAADRAQGASTFQLRMPFGDYYWNGNLFYSASGLQSANRPYLQIDYTGGVGAVPEPGTVSLFAAVAGALLWRRKSALAAKRKREAVANQGEVG